MNGGSDLLQAAKLLADAKQDFMLSYLICMAILKENQTRKDGAAKVA